MSWQLLGPENDYIAATRLRAVDRYQSWVKISLGDGPIEGSGIVVSRMDGSLGGSNIERNCYHSGGFHFLYREYNNPKFKEDDEEIVTSLCYLISNLCSVYYRDVQRKRDIVRFWPQRIWAVCQREGDYGTIHNHVLYGEDHHVQISGMIYLSKPEGISPDTFPNGCIHIIASNQVVFFPPIPGSVLLWPSVLMHGIHPFRGAGDRLGIAFDVAGELEVK
jgi:hypothetical protein